MDSAVFYDITKTFDENLKDGPPLLHSNLKPKERSISKMHKFLGFDVNVPFGMPAGPLFTSEYIKTAFEFGFDVNVYKTQRSRPVECNQFPNVVFVDVDGDLTLEKAVKPLVGTLTNTKPSTEF